MSKEQIKHLYGEAKGIYDSLEVGSSIYFYHKATVQQFNQIVDEAAAVLGRNLDRYKIGQDTIFMGGEQQNYEAQPVRSKVGSLVSMLEQEFELAKNATTSPVVMINQNQEQNQNVTVSLININELIEATHDEEVKEILQDLKEALNNKDEHQSKTLLAKLADKSWELFLKILPYVLEKWG